MAINFNNKTKNCVNSILEKSFQIFIKRPIKNFDINILFDKKEINDDKFIKKDGMIEIKIKADKLNYFIEIQRYQGALINLEVIKYINNEIQASAILIEDYNKGNGLNLLYEIENSLIIKLKIIK